MSRIAKAAALTAVAGAAIAGGAGVAAADSGARAVAAHSPGVLSGNVIQLPVHVPVNVCGNSVNIIVGLLNPTFGNACANISGHHDGYDEHEGRYDGGDRHGDDDSRGRWGQ